MIAAIINPGTGQTVFSVADDFKALFSAQMLQNLIGGAIRIALILAIGFLVSYLLRKLITTVVERKESQHRQTLSQVFSSAVKYVIYFFMFAAILEVFGISMTSVLAVAGIGGAAIGFGAQTLVKDVITGIFILMEEQYKVGDVVEINAVSGTVENIELRTTALRNGLTNELYIIPHSTITIVSNKTKDFQRAVVNLDIPYEYDFDQVFKTVAGAVQSYNGGDVMLSTPKVSGINNFSETGVSVQITCDCEIGATDGIEQDLRRLIKYSLEEKGVYLPYPTRIVHLEQTQDIS